MAHHRPARPARPAATHYDAWFDMNQDELRQTRKPSFVTPNGVTVQTLYTPEHLEKEGWNYQSDVGFPGQAPWTRGFNPAGYRRELWKTEMYAGFGSAEEANERYRYLMSQGSTGGISIALDLPTQIGYDSDHPMARDEVGHLTKKTALPMYNRLFATWNLIPLWSLAAMARLPWLRGCTKSSVCRLLGYRKPLITMLLAPMPHLASRQLCK